MNFKLKNKQGLGKKIFDKKMINYVEYENGQQRKGRHSPESARMTDR